MKQEQLVRGKTNNKQTKQQQQSNKATKQQTKTKRATPQQTSRRLRRISSGPLSLKSSLWLQYRGPSFQEQFERGRTRSACPAIPWGLGSFHKAPWSDCCPWSASRAWLRGKDSSGRLLVRRGVSSTYILASLRKSMKRRDILVSRLQRDRG